MEYNQKMLDAKLKLLERFKNKGPAKSPRVSYDRLPPGQHLTKGFPVLDLGVHPTFHTKRWRFAVTGEVESPLSVDWDGFVQLLPKVKQVSDFHCVTTWSKYDVDWAGFKFIDLAALVEPKETAHFVLMHSADGYTTNLPLEACMKYDVLLAYELDGKPLPVEHGGPMRMLVPRLFAWKSAKFLSKLEFLSEDKPGYWEERGYHNYGDPWREERYG
jgi:DMSO/TMAO reductase YedYZ molybdopterin-dependent catalytic subunit